MDIYLPCFHCAFQYHINDASQLNSNTVAQNDANYYCFTCQEGHYNQYILQNHKYDMAFEDGLEYMRNRKYKQAFIEFNTAQEAVLVFALQMLCYANQISIEMLSDAMKDIQSFSERIAGAFLFVYLMVFKKRGQFYSSKHKELRNNVIHKGYIPTEAETIDFTREIHRRIVSLLEEIKSLPNEIANTVFTSHYMREMHIKYQDLIKDSYSVLIHLIPTALSYANADYQSFEQLMQIK